MRLKSGVGIATIVVFVADDRRVCRICRIVGYPRRPAGETYGVYRWMSSDINNIVVDSNVLLRGVPVGKVTRIDTSVATATIHFYIDGQYQVPVDSDVRLDNLSALGESYIELEPRSSGGPCTA